MKFGTHTTQHIHRTQETTADHCFGCLQRRGVSRDAAWVVDPLVALACSGEGYRSSGEGADSKFCIAVRDRKTKPNYV